MGDTKTPHQRAREYAAGLVQLANDMYEAGRADFITSELPKLLELAREGECSEGCGANWEGDFTHSIPDLLAMAEKGET